MAWSRISRALGFGKPWLEKVKIEDLERERIRLENELMLLSREIERLEREKKELFRQGIGKSEVEKLLLAQKIKEKDMEIKMKLKEYNRLLKQRRAVVNLVMLKKHEKRLREKGIWDKIKDLSPDVLISALSQIELEEQMFEQKIDTINEVLSQLYTRVEVDKDVEEVMRLWEKVEKAELTPEAVEEQLKVKITEGEAEAEKEREKEVS